MHDGKIHMKYLLLLFLFIISLQCSGIGASFCYLLSYMVGRRLVQRFFPQRVADWRNHVRKFPNRILLPFNGISILQMRQTKVFAIIIGCISFLVLKQSQCSGSYQHRVFEIYMYSCLFIKCYLFQSRCLQLITD